MPKSSIYGQGTQEKTSISIIDGKKVAIVPYASFNRVLGCLAYCDSVGSENEFKTALINKLESKLETSVLIMAQRDSMVNNLVAIIKNKDRAIELDSDKIRKLDSDLTKEKKKVKIIGVGSCILIIIALIL